MGNVWQTENEKNEKNEKGYKAKKGTNGTKGNDVRKVNMYDICDFFVKPWTAGTGNSVALLLNNQPLSADLMISHAWAEDIQECAEALMLQLCATTFHTILLAGFASFRCTNQATALQSKNRWPWIRLARSYQLFLR